MSQVYLVGAGSGDVELLTLKAVNILKKADVVLYDALVNPEILKYCKSDSIKESVGKRKGKHLLSQDKINSLIVEYAKSHEVVVRLKGGTPFVFGRGYEEVRALKEHKIETVVVSGVSASTAVPESFMIPLIDREYSDSYRTITGHDIEKFDEIVTDYHTRENLIIVMGAHNSKKIVDILIDKKAYPKDTPIAFLSKGTTPEASSIVSTLENISKKDEEFFVKLKSMTPLIIYIGDTIKCSL
jgi:uroporphyrin-III C-methyltransferase